MFQAGWFFSASVVAEVYKGNSGAITSLPFKLGTQLHSDDSKDIVQLLILEKTIGLIRKSPHRILAFCLIVLLKGLC